MRRRNAVKTTSDTHCENLGLLANGSAGRWDVSIDCTVSGVERWFAQIEGPSLYLYFELPSLSIISRAIRYLAPQAGRSQTAPGSSSTNGELLVSSKNELAVSLQRDDEFQDRCFVVVGPGDRPVVRYSLTGEDMREIAEALRRAAKDFPKRASSAGPTNGANDTPPAPRSKK
jgi:hypothetical protein